MTTRFISGNRTAEDIIRAYYEKLQRQTEEEKILPRRNAVPPPPSAPTAITASGDYLLLENLTCVDADGNVFEQYNHLAVHKDIFRNSALQIINFTPYQAVAHCEKNGLFLPSFALTCNIIVALYKNRTNPEAEALLQQYKDYGAGHGGHAQNTVVNWDTEQIIHYPHENDFLGRSGKKSINLARQRTFLPFSRTQERKLWFNKSLSDTTLEKGLQDSLMTRFVRQLTGMENPYMLVEVGNYFGKPVYMRVPMDAEVANYTSSAWLCCLSLSFNLNANSSLNYYYAARGVRLEAQKI